MPENSLLTFIAFLQHAKKHSHLFSQSKRVKIENEILMRKNIAHATKQASGAQSH